MEAEQGRTGAAAWMHPSLLSWIFQAASEWWMFAGPHFLLLIKEDP